jgi:Ca2+-binding RTX toxin-like protein
MARSIPLDHAAFSKVVGGAFQQGTAYGDMLSGTSEADVVFAGGGNDQVSTGASNDYAYGEAGNDVINTGSGNDLAYGGSGHDVINGGAGQDQLQGEDGDDRLDGGVGDGAADLAVGAEGNDSYIWTPGDGNDQFQGGVGSDTLQLDNVSLPQLQAALTLEGNTGLQMSVSTSAQGQPVVSFTDAAGNPTTFQGRINIGGETMVFSQIERIVLV